VSSLMISVSGVRGIVGDSLTPEIIQKYTLAFGSYLQGSTVIVGGDSRTSGSFVRNIVRGCLQATGNKVIDIGIVATPTVQMEILHHKTAGGIAITASHNPPEWNGLKFMDSNGRFLSPLKAEGIYKSAEETNFNLKKWHEVSDEVFETEANHRHINAILNLQYIDKEALNKQNFKVVVDCVNGAGGLIIPDLLHELGCEVIVINGKANGHFAHNPEPRPAHLKQLAQMVKDLQADVGFAVDPDVDRCAIIDNSGMPIGEEYTLAAAVKFILSKKLGPVVVNMSTSRAAEDIAKYYNCPFKRTKVGEIHVAEEMAQNEAVIGGEGNGGVILPDLHLGRDAPVAIALLLQFLMEFEGTMQDLYLSLPQYKIVKRKIELKKNNPDKILENLANKYSDKEINFLDGLKIDSANTWVHIRKSNTEPIIRVMAEAPTETESQELANMYCKDIQDLMNK
jgi:phosphomannomutase